MLPTLPALLATCALLTAAPAAPATTEEEGHTAARQSPSSWSVDAFDGTLLFGTSFGSGPDLLFVHGGPSFPPLQRPEWLTALAAHRRVHLFHQRGSGRSSRPLERLPDDEEEARRVLRETYGIEAHLRDVDAVLDARFGRDRPVVVVGHSFGAALSALFAARRPQRVARLVLLAPADVLDGTPEDPALLERLEAMVPDAEREACRERLRAFLSPGPLAGALDAELARRTDWFGWYFLNAMGWSVPRPDTYPPMKWAGGLSVAGLFLDLGELGDARSELARIDAPTLVLHAEEDLSPAEASRAFAEAIPGARLETVAGTRHFFRSASAITAERIEAFLAPEPGAPALAPASKRPPVRER